MRRLLLAVCVSLLSVTPAAAQVLSWLDRADIIQTAGGPAIVAQGWAARDISAGLDAPRTVVLVDDWFGNGAAPLRAVPRPDVCAAVRASIWPILDHDDRCAAVRSYLDPTDWWGHLSSGQCGAFGSWCTPAQGPDVGLVSLPIPIGALARGPHTVRLWLWIPQLDRESLLFASNAITFVVP